MNDLPLGGLSERELVLLAVERIGALNSHFEKLASKLDDHERRLGLLENASSKQSGFFAGANWMKQLFVALPPSILAFFIGGGKIPD
jgi:hypothetical protein